MSSEVAVVAAVAIVAVAVALARTFRNERKRRDLVDAGGDGERDRFFGVATVHQIGSHPAAPHATSRTSDVSVRVTDRRLILTSGTNPFLILDLSPAPDGALPTADLDIALTCARSAVTRSAGDPSRVHIELPSQDEGRRRALDLDLTMGTADELIAAVAR